MQPINTEVRFTKYVVTNGLLTTEKFRLIDVGVSGGFDRKWFVFLPDLIAYGFDPLVSEIRRLQKMYNHPNIHLHDYFVTCRGIKEIDERTKSKNNDPTTRSSAFLAIKLLNMDYIGTYYDPTGEGKHTDKYITLDEFCEQEGIEDIDFIKIDTDGHDYMVLKGAENIIKNKNLLGIMIEAQFHGIPHDEANVFANIDRFMRYNGFTLFDLSVNHYSKSALPKKFIHNMPSSTYGGQILWGDALYLRDLARDNYEIIWEKNFTVPKILKLGCLFELFGLEDCTAELIIKHKDKLSKYIDVKHALNIITPGYNGQNPSAYTDYIKLFRQYVREQLGNTKQRQ